MSIESLACRDLLGRLIAFDTTTRNSNLPLIDFVENYLERLGVPSIRVDYQEGKTNLYATIGPDNAGGVVLSGHTDVVPVDGQDWESDPFTLSERDGRFYGRGTADMKGFVAACLALVPEFLARDLAVPIHLAFSCDEEVGCKGVRPLVKRLAEQIDRPACVIVGEPTLMRVVDAHKGIMSYQTMVTGHEAHSSCTHIGVNAIMVAGEVLGEVSRIAADMRARGGGEGRFDPPYTTVHVGVIAGGTAKNIVPRHCHFDWESRLLPGSDPDEIPARLAEFCEHLTPAMHAVNPDTGIETRSVNRVPELKPEPGSPAEALAMHLAEANGTGAVSYGTEAGLFQEIGIPAVVCGPGSIEQAHKPDEYVEASELMACERFLRRLADHCARRE